MCGGVFLLVSHGGFVLDGSEHLRVFPFSPVSGLIRDSTAKWENGR